MKEKKNIILITLSVLLIAIDQLSKILVSIFINNPLGNDIIGFEVATNRGIAFGLNDSSNLANIVLTIAILGLIISFIKKQNEKIDNKTMVALSLMISGGISNLIDRFIRGGVLDFIKIYKFPIFNLADIFVVIGWILLIVFIMMYSSKKVGD